MFLYMIKRICGAIVVLWAVITITFGLMHAIPGGPFTEEKKREFDTCNKRKTLRSQ